MLLKDLAAALGISPAMVTKLKKKGMPTSSVEAADKWRRRHLEHARTKGNRAGTEVARRSAEPATPPAAVPGSPSVSGAVTLQIRQLLRTVEELGLLALDSIGRNTFALVAPHLRLAMAQVPLEAREHIALPLPVWDALTAAIGESDPAPEDAAAGDLSDEFMGTFWSQVALGELSDLALVQTEAGWQWVRK